MKKTLIVYGTRKGATADTARVILDVLTKQFSYQVDVIDVKHLKKVEKNLEEYNNIIVGSSIVSGRWVSKVLRFLKKYDFSNKKIVVFLSAGGTLNKVNKYGISKEEAIKEAVNNYIDKVGYPLNWPWPDTLVE